MARCIFCRIAAKEIPSQIVRETKDFVAFRDANPQAPKHILIVPTRHIPSANDLAPADADLVGRMILLAREIAASEGLAGPGYRLVINTNADGGQSVDHMHLHLLGGRAMGWPPG